MGNNMNQSQRRLPEYVLCRELYAVFETALFRPISDMFQQFQGRPSTRVMHPLIWTSIMSSWHASHSMTVFRPTTITETDESTETPWS